MYDSDIKIKAKCKCLSDKQKENWQVLNKNSKVYIRRIWSMLIAQMEGQKDKIN